MGIRESPISVRVGICLIVSLLFLLPVTGLWAEVNSPVVEVFEALNNRPDSLGELRLRVRFDGPIRIVFSQGMDRFSTEYAFSLEHEGQKKTVPGKIAWNEDNTSLFFTPDRAPERDARYICTISTSARDGLCAGHAGGLCVPFPDQVRRRSSLRGKQVGFRLRSAARLRAVDVL